MLGVYGRFLLLPILTAITAAQDVKPPHIILIVADDLGWNDVGVHGSRLVPTPNIDALAASGRLLRRHYTLPTCTPSRAALLTGRHAAATGMQGFPLRAGEPRGLPLQIETLPQRLKERGYVTRLVGKWHLGAHRSEFLPTNRGFDSHLGYRNGYIGYFDHSLGQNIPPDKRIEGSDMWRDVDPAFDTRGRYFTHALTAEATRIIRSHSRAPMVNEQPLFLQVAHLAVHTGNDSTPMEVPDPEATHKRYGYEPDVNRRLYAGMLLELDDSVGEVIAALRDTRMLNNSIVIFISDNGGMPIGLHCNYGSNWPMRGTKHTLFEGGVRTVGAIWSPFLPRRSSYSNLLHIMDWAPTLLTAVDTALHGPQSTPKERPQEVDLMEGVSHWEALTAKDDAAIPTPREEMLLNVDDVINHSGIRMGRWKYVEGFHENGSLDGHEGAPARGDDYPAYDAEATARAARSLELDATLTAQDVLRTQQLAEVSCNGLENELGSPACTNGCLFDLEEDPCEMRDLSLTHPEMLHSLRERLQVWRERSSEQLNQSVDPASDPSLHGGVWAPWLDGKNGDGIGDHWDITDDSSGCGPIDINIECSGDGRDRKNLAIRQLYSDDEDEYSGHDGDMGGDQVRDKGNDLESGNLQRIIVGSSQLPNEVSLTNTEDPGLVGKDITEKNKILDDSRLKDYEGIKQSNDSDTLTSTAVFPLFIFILIYLSK